MHPIKLAVALALATAAAAPAIAAVPQPTYVQFSGAAKGALYKPDPALYPSPHVGVIVMHRNSNYLNHISTKELPKRGFVVLGMNPRCDNNEALCAPWENNSLDLKQGVNYLKSQPGITKIVLLGHSGGGPTMTFYEAVAEHGAAFCEQPNKLSQCNDSFNGFPKVDGMILMDAHPGNGINAVRSILGDVNNDSAVVNQNRAPTENPTLDPFNPRNGYVQGGITTYSDAFKSAYFKAQSDRENYLIAQAQQRLAEAQANGQDDAPFIVPLADNARLMQVDLSIHHSTLLPRKLLKNDGTVESRFPVVSVRPVSTDSPSAHSFGATMFLTTKSFLSVRAVKSTDSMDGIDFCSSNNSTPCNLQNMTIPLLVTNMGGHYFIRDGEQYFDMAASPDKDFYVIEGATHGGTECTACETTPGQYNNATKNLFDLMARWMDARYGVSWGQ